MTRRVFGAAALVAAVVGLTAQDAAAFGRKKKADCGTTGGAVSADCGGAVAYVDQVVTTYKPVWKTKPVKTEVCEYRWVDEPCTVKVCEIKEDKVPCTYTVHEWQQVPDVQKVCKAEWKERKEDCVTYERQYVKQPVKRVVYDTVCVPTEVTVPVSAPACDGGKRKGLFARLCGKKSCDDPCPAPPACEYVTHTVMKTTLVPRTVDSEEVVCKLVPKPGFRMVKYCEYTWVDVPVKVWKCVPVVKNGHKIVHTPHWVEKPGTKKVCKKFCTEKVIDQPYCELVKCETVVKVPVRVPCATDCGPTYPVGAGMSGGCGSAAACGGCP